MRDLHSSEIHQISGGEGWSDLQVIAATAATSATATLLIGLLNFSKTTVSKLFASVLICPIAPTLLMTAAVYAKNAYESQGEE